MEGPRCAHVEALILCRSYDAALDACARLQPGSLDAAYLRAEAQWRAGRPDAASATLHEALGTRGDACNGKCSALARFVQKLLVRRFVSLHSAPLGLSWQAQHAGGFGSSRACCRGGRHGGASHTDAHCAAVGCAARGHSHAGKLPAVRNARARS
jgi:hypothetical protein